MATCEKCGASMNEDALACEICGHRIGKTEAAAAIPAPVEASPAPSMKYRPTGGTAIVLGWVCMGFSALCGLLALGKMGGVGLYGYQAYGMDLNPALAGWLWAAGRCFDAGVVLLVVGYILRAIWFLPGPEEKAVR